MPKQHLIGLHRLSVIVVWIVISPSAQSHILALSPLAVPHDQYHHSGQKQQRTARNANDKSNQLRVREAWPRMSEWLMHRDITRKEE